MYVQSDIETHLSLKQCVKLTFMAGARFSVRDKTDSHKSVKGSYSKKKSDIKALQSSGFLYRKSTQRFVLHSWQCQCTYDQFLFF